MPFRQPKPLAGDYEFIPKCDDALNRKDRKFKQKYAEYLERGNANVLPFKTGQSPTIFILRHLPPSVSDRLLSEFIQAKKGKDDPAMTAVAFMAAQYGIRDWINYTTEDGGEVEVKHSICPIFKCEQLDDELMEGLRRLQAGGAPVVYEIGAAVMRAATLGPLSKRG